MSRENYERETGGHRQPSPMDFLSSAKVIGEAAQMASRRETDKVDKAKVASAAEDVLEAAKKYGKLEEKGMGQYVQKAETYLHGYHSRGEKPADTSNPSGTKEEKKEGGSGYGDYLKMAEGFLNKPGEGDKSKKKESGYGDYLKMAGGFLK